MTYKALLMEDDPASNHLITKALEKRGFYVKSCLNAAEGLFHFIRDLDYDIIITDIMMPEVDGIEFLKVVDSLRKRNMINNGPQVIVETAIRNYKDLKFITSMDSVHSVHEKPLKLETLMISIEQVINGKLIDKEFNEIGH